VLGTGGTRSETCTPEVGGGVPIDGGGDPLDRP
jgi:hypothetical protein